MKRFILKEEEEIIRKVENNIPFDNLGEVEVYLKHMINNRDYYIKENTKSPFFDGEEIAWITGAIISICFIVFGGSFLLGKIFPLIPILSGIKTPTIFGALKIAALSIPVAFGYYGLEKFLATKKAEKLVNQEIKALKLKCGYAKDNDKALEEMRTIADSYKAPAKDVDQFISMIYKNIINIVNIKYPGFKQDVADLYDLTQHFLDAKKAMKVTSENYVLSSSSEWFKKLNEIEARIETNSKIKNNQELNMQVLDQISQVLAEEDIALNGLSSTLDSKDDPINLKLTL